METIVGIDPSLRSTAVCVYRGGRSDMSLFGSEPAGHQLRVRMLRWIDLANRISQCVREAEPEAVFIEGYSLGSRGRAVFDTAEFGGLLRFQLLPFLVYEVPPTTLKKFTAGKGNAGKTAVVAALTHRYGVMFGTDDEYDAFGLAKLGACVMKHEKPQTAKQQEVVAVVTGQSETG